MRLLKLFLYMLTLASTSIATASESNSVAAFQRLAALVGTWEGTLPSGKKQIVAFRLTAAGSTLVETWTLGPDRESMTLYSLDGAQLIATHYCPQGNQPRLVLKPTNNAALLSFEFKDGTNLQVPDASHQYRFWLRLDSPDSFTRSETYVANGATADELTKAKPDVAITYKRVSKKHR